MRIENELAQSKTPRLEMMVGFFILKKEGQVFILHIQVRYLKNEDLTILYCSNKSKLYEIILKTALKLGQ